MYMLTYVYVNAVLWSIAESMEIEARTAEPIDDSTILTDSPNLETFENEDDTYEAYSSDEYEPEDDDTDTNDDSDNDYSETEDFQSGQGKRSEPFEILPNF